jgi:hypothetical protein
MDQQSERQPHSCMVPKATALLRLREKAHCSSKDSDDRVYEEDLVNQPMTREQRRNAKAQVVATMNQGQSRPRSCCQRGSVNQPCNGLSMATARASGRGNGSGRSKAWPCLQGRGTDPPMGGQLLPAGSTHTKPPAPTDCARPVQRQPQHWLSE